MDYLRRLRMERPMLFLVVLFVGIWLGLQLLLTIASILLSGFNLPSWVPLVAVLAALVVVARRQQRL